MLCQDCLPTVECMTCQYYCPHYIKRGGRYVPLAYGHCTRPAERGQPPNLYRCRHWLRNSDLKTPSSGPPPSP